MTAFYWIVAVPAALLFLAAGAMKIAKPARVLDSAGTGASRRRPTTPIRLLGVAEVAGSVGLLVPALTQIAPVLSPVAGACLAVVAIGAVVVHLRRRESVALPAVLVVLTLAAAALGATVIA